MFFSTDLLRYKKGIFCRIWLLGSAQNQKVKSEDLKIKSSRIADGILEWVNRSDYRRLSLPLSATMSLGLSITIHEKSRRLRRDVDEIERMVKRMVKKSSTEEEKIDLDPVAEEPDNDVSEHHMDQLSHQSFALALVDLSREDRNLMKDEAIGARQLQPDFNAEEDDWFGDGPSTAVFPGIPDLFKDDALDDLANADVEEYDATHQPVELPKVQPMAPPRSGAPENGNRDMPPPMYPDSELPANSSQENDEEEAMELETPIRFIDEPAVVDDMSNMLIDEPVAREEMQLEIEPAQECHQEEEMDIGSLSPRMAAPPKKRPRLGRRKHKFFDECTQLPMDEIRANLEQESLSTSKSQPPNLLIKSPEELFTTFGRPCMTRVLRENIKRAAFDDKFSDDEESDATQKFNFASSQSFHSDIRGGSTLETSVLKPPELEPCGVEPYGLEQSEQEPSGLEPFGLEPSGPEPPGLERIEEEPLGLELSGLEQEVNMVNEDAVSVSSFSDDAFWAQISSGGRVAQDFGCDILARGNFRNRREVAKAFEALLGFEKEGKIKCDQQEYNGKITVTME